MDNILIDWALDQLNDEILDAQIDGMNLAQIAEQRTVKSCHFGNVYKNEYQAIKYAYQMMKAVSVLEVTSDIKAIVQIIRNRHIWLILIIDGFTVLTTVLKMQRDFQR